MRIRKMGRVAATAVISSALALGMAVTASADPIGVGEETDVDVEVDITAAGELTMEVATGSIALTEDGSDATARRFVGALPEVTVTDTRTGAELPGPGIGWYVMGTASKFVDGAKEIGAGNFGWTPELVTLDPTGNVVEGPQVDTVMDAPPNNVGLVDKELLVMALESDDAATPGVWKATADVFLHTPVDVDGGSYAAKLTLSLWED